MSGWVADWYGKDYCSSAPAHNPPGPATGGSRVVRGGSWQSGLDYRHRTTLHPERVRSIVLMGSGPPTRAQTLQCQDAIVQRAIRLVQQGFISEHPEPNSREAERGYLPAYFSDPSFWFSADDPGRAPLLDERTAQVNDLTRAANANYDLTADLAELNQRVLNLWGDDDPVRPIASPAIVAALPNAAVETVVLSQCGHFWHERPGAFLSRVRAFPGLPTELGQ
ncbi:MAG: alpha/beta hydrolase [Anaerolineae bacterium]|nr:alpha/beta hydrolase [Anaerolineae bacterium]